MLRVAGSGDLQRKSFAKQGSRESFSLLEQDTWTQLISPQEMTVTDDISVTCLYGGHMARSFNIIEWPNGENHGDMCHH